MAEVLTAETGLTVIAADQNIPNDEALIALFLRRKFQRSQSMATLTGYQRDLVQFMAYMNKPLARITASDLMIWSNTLDTKAPATQARTISAVRSLFRFAYRLGYLRFNPTEILERPRIPITSDQHFLTRAELQDLVQEAKRPRRSVHLYPALVLLSTTALRVSELLGINWGHFFQDPLGHVGLQVVKAKGGKPRVVKILPEVWQIVLAHRTRLGLPVQLDSSDGTPLFLGKSEKSISVRNLQKSLTAAPRAAGIRKKVSPHWIRHTSITLALVGGARVEQAQAMAGHSDLRTTARYAHTAQQLKETASDYIRLEF